MYLSQSLALSVYSYSTNKFTPEAKNLIISPHYRPFTLCEKSKAIGKNVYAWRLTFAGGDESVVFNEVEFVVFVASVDIDSKEAMNKPNIACLGEKYIVLK